MSGTTIGFGNNLTPVYSDALAREGSKACLVKVQWAQTFTGGNAAGVVNINLLQQYQTNQFTAIQAVYINNTTCPYQVTLQCNETGFVITVPPFTQGMYPLLSSSAPTFLAVLNYDADSATGIVIFNCSTTFHFLNTPQGRYQDSLPKYGNNFNSISQAPTFCNLAQANPVLAQYYWKTGVPILPPIPANNYYLINSISFTLNQLASTGGTGNNYLALWENNTPNIGGNIGNNYIRFVAIFIQSPDSAGQASATHNYQLLQVEQIFDPPILIQTAGAGCNVGLLNATPITGPLPDGSGLLVCGMTLTYGTVLIQ